MTEICPGFELSGCLIKAFNPGKTAAVGTGDFSTLLADTAGVFPAQADTGPDEGPVMSADFLDKPAALLVPSTFQGVKSVPETADELLEPDHNASAAILFEAERPHGQGVPAVNAAGEFGVSPAPGPAGHTGAGTPLPGPTTGGAVGDAGVSDSRTAVPGAVGDVSISYTRTAAPGAVGDVVMNHTRSVVPAEIIAKPEPVLPAGDFLKPVDRLLVPGAQPAEVQSLTAAEPGLHFTGADQGKLAEPGGITRESPLYPGIKSEAVRGNKAQAVGTAQSALGTKADNAPVNAVERFAVEGKKANPDVPAAPAEMPPARPATARGTTRMPHPSNAQKAPVVTQSQILPPQSSPNNPVTATRGPVELAGRNAGNAVSSEATAIPLTSEQDTAVHGAAANRGVKGSAEAAPHAAPPPGRVGPAVLEAAPVQAEKGLTDHAFTGAELPRAIQDPALVSAVPGAGLVDPQEFGGVGKIPLTDLPGLLSQRIAHRLGSLEGHSGVIRIQFHLDPPELGSVAVRIALDGGELKVHFFANDAVVKEALTGAVPELRAELERIGLNLGETYVSVDQEHGRGFGPQLHQWRTRFWSFEGDSPHAEMVIDEGINYLV